MIERQRILIVGAGGREHALAHRCRTEGHFVQVAPGSDGIAEDAERVAIAMGDPERLIAHARAAAIDLVIVGPEQPLCDGLADRLRGAGVPVLGPSAAAARLEGSKADAKAFMHRHGIPTARSVTVDGLAAGLRALGDFATPPVIKASGLAAGKGVTVAATWEEAEAALRDCLEGHVFGGSGEVVVLEERLEGEEASFFVLTDGAAIRTFAPAQDHKRLGDGDSGPNTGGMGAYAPAPICTPAIEAQVIDRIVTPTLAGLRAEGRPFVGVLFVGLMIDRAGVARVIEYNCRFGDPEAQPLLFGLEEPVVPHLVAAAHGRLSAGRLRGRPAVSVVLASAGYPRTSTRGVTIHGLDEVRELPGVKVFHAGTRRDGDRWVTDGGRVAGVCAVADDLRAAIDLAYSACDRIHFDGVQRRRDIGVRALT
ncbi:MAG: phosphoribosylamine--glycine ligase [Nannocystaceae bacterium]